MSSSRAGAALASMFALALALTALVASAGQASSASVSGKWVSATPGEGFIEWDVMSKRHYDWEMTLSQSGSDVTASVTYTLRSVDVYHLPDVWSSDIGFTHSGVMFGTAMGDQLVFDLGQFGDSGQFVLTVSGNTIYGSGTFISAGATEHYEFDLKREGLFGFFGTSMITPIASLGFIVVFIVIIVTVLKPVRIPMTPSVTRVPPYNPTYVPSDVRTTGEPTPVSGPEGGISMGGAGLYIPPPPPTGRPLPPKEHFSRSQEPPRCPIHGDAALVAHFKSSEGDPGSWYCPKCKGYPWGRS